MHNHKCKTGHKCKMGDAQGFTLVEISISLVIIGLLLSMGTLIIPRLAFQFQEEGTYRKFDTVHRAISLYTQRYNRVPCPAEPNAATTTQPYGSERGSGAAGNNQGQCNTQASRHGIVPFRTLGLSIEDAKDSFGNFFTYKVSGTSSRQRASTTEYISQWCRTVPQWHNTAFDLDPEKAAFCCGSLMSNNIAWVNQDLSVEGPFGPMPKTMRNINRHGGATGEYTRTSSGPPNEAQLRNDFRPSFVAYALISHGSNGYGSYNNAGTQKPGQWLSNRERDNARNTQRRVFVPDNTADVPNAGDPGVGIKRPFDRSEIDDIVSWKTPAQAYAYVGNQSCFAPRRR